MSRANGKAPPDPLEELDDVIAELEGAEWEEDSEVTEVHNHIVIQPAAETGRFTAMENTRPDNPRAKQESLPEKVIDAVADMPDRAKTWPQAAVAIAIVVGLVAFAFAWLWR